MPTTHAPPKDPSETPPEEGAIWCVEVCIVAHQVPTGRARGTVAGTKHFQPGAKVWAIDWLPSAEENLVVIGRHRKSRQFVRAAVSASQVQQPLVKSVDMPGVVALGAKYVKSAQVVLSREHAEAVLGAIGAGAESFTDP